MDVVHLDAKKAYPAQNSCNQGIQNQKRKNLY